MLAGCDTAVDSDPADPADGQVTAPTSKQTSQSSVEELALHIQRASTEEEAARAPFRCYIRMRSTANWGSRQLSAWEAGPSAVEQSMADVQRLSDASFQYDTIILHPSDTWLQSVRASGESLNAVQLRYQLRSPDGTVLREAYCRVPDQADVKRQIVAQLAWSTQAHVSPSYATIEQEKTACDDADVCITETAHTTDVGSALYVPQSCDGPGGGGGDGDSGGGGGDAGGGNWPPDDGDGGGSDWPDNPSGDPFPDDPPESPDPPDDPPEDPPESPPSDPAPPDDGDDNDDGDNDDCSIAFEPSDDCERVIAVASAQSVFGIATQSCCIRCPDEPGEPDEGDGTSLLPPSLGQLDGMPTPSLPSSRPSEVTPDAWNDIQQQWNSLNSTEKKLCLFSPVHCGAAAAEARRAISFADELYPTSQRRNGPNDALKHARWAAGMTRSMNAINAFTGATWAHAWLSAHENFPNNPQAEYDMDMHNNAVGIQIGQDAMLDVSQRVEDAWRDGALQEWACPNHPTDRRMGCIPPALR